MMWALVLGAGPNSVCLSPPLVINKDQADHAVQVLAECMALIAG